MDVYIITEFTENYRGEVNTCNIFASKSKKQIKEKLNGLATSQDKNKRLIKYRICVTDRGPEYWSASVQYEDERKTYEVEIWNV